MTELFALGFVELTASFLLALSVIAGNGTFSDGLTLDLAALLAVASLLMSLATGAYRAESLANRRRIVVKASLAQIFALLGAVVVIALLDSQNIANLRLLALACLACLALLLLLRNVFGYALRAGVFTRRLVIVGNDAELARLRAALAQRVCHGFDIVAHFTAPPPGEAAAFVADCRRRDIWAVVTSAGVSLPTAQGLRVVSLPDFWERFLQRIDLDTLDQRIVPDSRGHGLSAALHRLTDLALCLGLLFFSLPLMLATMLAIKLDGGGPVLYRQERIGLHGKPFVLLKFRSMRPDAEASGPVWAMQQDKRVTRVGQFIRLSRIDELPQLFNILRGEMSFIGPRPERPMFVAQLTEAIPFYADRAQVKPGLTGWAQVNYPYGASVEDARAKLSYDLYYVKQQSFVLDMLIVFSTIRVILFQEGAR